MEVPLASKQTKKKNYNQVKEEQQLLYGMMRVGGTDKTFGNKKRHLVWID